MRGNTDRGAGTRAKKQTGKQRKRQAGKLLAAVLLAGLFLALPGQDALAARKTPYTYTVTFYAGNHGTFSGSAGLTVENGAGDINVTEDKITVSGLTAGAIVSFNTQAGALTLPEGGKYYIRGLRKSGRDNGTAAASAFRVTGDADYVAAYGIKGDTVAYTVYFEDAAGNTLSESQTYYGNVGDKPVVAYAYVDGYTPDVLAQTKTLSANAAENVFTFLYTPNEELGEAEGEPPAGTEPGAPGAAPSVEGPAEQTPATTTPTAPTTPTTTTPAQTPAAATPATPEAADAGAAPDADTVDLEEPADITAPDDDVPLGDQDLRDLDDEENEQTPTSNIKLPDEEEVAKGLPLALYAGIGTAAGVGLAALLVILTKRRKKAKAKTGDADGTDKPGNGN